MVQKNKPDLTPSQEQQDIPVLEAQSGYAQDPKVQQELMDQEKKLLALREEIAQRQKELLAMQDDELKNLRAAEAEQELKKIDPWKKQREADERPCRIRFEFREQPGGSLEFCYKKYPGEPLKSYTGPKKLQDGHTYTLPLGVVKHLMSSGRCPEYKHERVMDEDPTGTYIVGAWRTRYTAVPLDFIADQELQSIQDPQILSAQLNSTLQR